MIENIRNYYGLMMVVLVALFLSFLFTGFSGSKSGLGSGDGPAFIRVDGTGYDQQQYRKLAVLTFHEAQGNLGMQYGNANTSGNFGMTMFAYALGVTRGGDENAQSEAFFLNRLAVRQAGEEFGIHPSEDEIEDYLRKLPLFTNNPKHEFDQTIYTNYVTKYISRNGLVEKDIRDLASDAIISDKISAIVGSGLAASPVILGEQKALDTQLVSVQLAPIPIAPFKDAIKPTDDEIKSYWEIVKDGFKTEPKRKFTYLVAVPQQPEVKAPEPKPEDAKPEDAKPGEAKPEKPDPTKEDPKVIAEREKLKLEMARKVDDFVYDLAQKKGANFEEEAKSKGFETKTTGLVAASEAPAEFNKSDLANPRGDRAVDVLFGMRPNSDPFSKISDAMSIGDGQWLIARVDEEEPSRVKTFEEAKDLARAQYVEEKAREAMHQDAEAKLKAVREAVGAGKSFADAAKEAGLETKSIGPVSASYQSTDGTAPAGRSLFQSARLQDPGTVADLIVEPERIFLLFVEKREVVKMPNEELMLASGVKSAAERNKNMAYASWLAERAEAMKVERLSKR